MSIIAKWNGQTIASSSDTVVVEGNHYFPRDDVQSDVLSDSDTTSHCPWKGTAQYHSISVGGETNADAAWYYADPREGALQIKDRIAFWKGVEIIEE